nr:hypothetical protein [Allomuricauda sp.]
MNSNTLPIVPLLKYTYGLVPIIAGLDKHTNLLTSWDQYLPQGLLEFLPASGANFMLIIGGIEILAGIIVLLRPKPGALIVCLWLVLIALVLIFSGSHLDVAVRDLVMAIGAFALYGLSTNSETT